MIFDWREIARYFKQTASFSFRSCLWAPHVFFFFFLQCWSLFSACDDHFSDSSLPAVIVLFGGKISRAAVAMVWYVCLFWVIIIPALSWKPYCLLLFFPPWFWTIWVISWYHIPQSHCGNRGHKQWHLLFPRWQIISSSYSNNFSLSS